MFILVFNFLFSLYFTCWFPFACDARRSRLYCSRSRWFRACLYQCRLYICVCLYHAWVGNMYFVFVLSLIYFVLFLCLRVFTSIASTTLFRTCLLVCTARVRAACIRAISVCVLVICRVWMCSTTYFVLFCLYVIFIFHLILFLFYCYFYSFCSQSPFWRLYCSRSRWVGLCLYEGAVSVCVCVLVMCHACMRTYFVSVLSLIVFILLLFCFLVLCSHHFASHSRVHTCTYCSRPCCLYECRLCVCMLVMCHACVCTTYFAFVLSLN